MNQKQLYLTFICLTAFLVKLNAATITWTGTTNNLWEEPTNWDVGIVPTSTDDVIINIGVQGIYSSSNINIKSLLANEQLNLYGNNNNTLIVSDLVTIIGQSSCIIGTFKNITLNHLNINDLDDFAGLSLQNVTINGTVIFSVTNGFLKLFGQKNTLNNGVTMSNGNANYYGFIVESDSTIVNGALTIPCKTSLSKGYFGGTGSITLLGTNHQISDNTYQYPVTIDIPITMSGTSANATNNVGNVAFKKQLTIQNTNNAAFFIQSYCNTATTINSTIAAYCPLNFIGCTNALLTLSGATSINPNPNSVYGVSFYINTNITNTTFNNIPNFLGNTNIYAVNFNNEAYFQNYNNNIISMKAGGVKNFSNTIHIYGNVNWEGGDINKTNNTNITLYPSATLNITTTNGFLPNTNSQGTITNNGTINFEMADQWDFHSIPMRLYNNGKIKVKKGYIELKSIQFNSDTVNIAQNAWLALGGFNQTHYIQNAVKFTGQGNLGLYLGNFQINQPLNIGTLSFDISSGAYLSGSGSLTIPSGSNMYWGDAWITIPVALSGTIDTYSYNGNAVLHRLSNNIAINTGGKFIWDASIIEFRTNGKISNYSGTIEIKDDASQAIAFSGATNIEIYNCGNITIQVPVNITVPINYCSTAILGGVGTMNLAAIPSITGDISPGNSPGTLTINPGINIVSGKTIIELTENAGIVSKDLLTTVGDITLNGTLNIITSGVIPIGNYDIITANGTISGTYNQVTLNGSSVLPASMSIIYGINKVSIILSAVLPIKLLDFSGKNTEKGNLLAWEATDYVDFSHFELEKSERGDVFYTLTRINPDEEKTYSFLDTEPYSSTYYRLKMLSKDNTYEYSNIITIYQKNITNKAIEIYPNPAKQNMFLKINTTNTQIAYLKIRDNQGQIISEKEIALNKGENILYEELGSLSAGCYYVELTDTSNTIIQKLIKY